MKSWAQMMPNRASLLAACAIGLFFVWFEALFPLCMGLDGTDLSRRPGFFNDLSWLASIAATCVDCIALGIRTRKANKIAPGKGNLEKRCLMMGSVGAAAMVAGSISLVSGITPCWIPIAGGALTGLGATLLVTSWLPGAAYASNASKQQVIVLSIAASIAVTALLGAFNHSASLFLLAALPVLAQAFAALSMRSAETGADLGPRPGDNASRSPSIERAPLLSAQNTVTAACFFAVFFVLSLIGSRVDLTLTTETFWLVNASGVANLILLVLLVRFLDTARLKFILVILAATSVAAMPLSMLIAGENACFVLVKVATFFAYALSLLYIAGTIRPDHGLADSCGRALSLLGILAGAVLTGTLAGNAAHLLLADNDLVTSLISIVLLWGILLVIVLAAMSGRIRVEHVIKGSFDDVSDIAQARCGIIAQQHPDLSDRERDVLELVLLGYSTPRIAQRLVVSENTVKTHLRHIYTKLEIGSRQELMAMAEEIPVGGKQTKAALKPTARLCIATAPTDTPAPAVVRSARPMRYTTSAMDGTLARWLTMTNVLPARWASMALRTVFWATSSGAQGSSLAKRCISRLDRSTNATASAHN